MGVLEVEFSGVLLKNPFMAASGTFGYGELLEDFNLPFGLFVTKGISLEPLPGNDPPRVFEVDSGLVNRIGLQNVGLGVFLEKISPRIDSLGVPYMVNILGFSTGEFVELYSSISQKTHALAVEVNISCPNVKGGGIQFSQNVGSLRELSQALKGCGGKPISIKLPPTLDPSILEEYLDIFDGVSSYFTVANTYPCLVYDWKLGRFFEGGLSGPAIKPLTLRMVREVSRRTDTPVIASGGVISGRSALEYFMAGAKFVQLGTVSLLNPFSVSRIVEEVEGYLEAVGLSHIWEVVGS